MSGAAHDPTLPSRPVVLRPPGTDEDRLLTVPNVISIARLACLPVFLWLLFGRENRAAAASLLAVLGATDFVDGYIARHFNQVSTLGKILDPVADRSLFFIGGLAIFLDGSVPTVVFVVVIVRETLVSVATVLLAVAGASRIDVTWYGKAGTFALMVAFPLFLAAESTLGWRDVASVIAWVMVVPGIVLGYIALGLYIPMALRALREGRAARTASIGTGPR